MLGLLSLAALASCSIKDDLQPAEPARHFRAVMEQLAPDASTKAYSDETYHLFWNADDRISIFFSQTFNREYAFMGDNGDTAGGFEQVGEDPSGSAPAIQSGFNYAVYPYTADNACDSQGTLTVVFPEQQVIYDKGIGARPLMAARAEKGDFIFKHLGAYVGVRLVGEDVTVKSISFQGNNNEILAGPAAVTFADDGIPVLTFNQAQSSSSITMTLETPVDLDAEEAKVFWLNVPAGDYSGYTLTVTDPAGGTYQKVRTEGLTLQRSYFYDLDATVVITPAPLDESSYAKASTITVGGTYLIVDAADQRLFKGAIDGSFLNVSPEDGIITDADGTLAAYEFTVEQSGSNYYLKFNDGKYLISNWNSPGNGSTGLCYVDTQNDVRYPYALTVSEGAFMFSTTQVNSSSSTNQVLYYKAEDNFFKIGGSGRTIGVHLYLKGGGGGDTPPKQTQTLSFSQPTVTWTLGQGYETGSSYALPQTVSGAETTVSYTSETPAVVTIGSNNRVTIVAAGSATIKATAAETDEYYGATATYTLNIATPAPEGWQDKGTFNLENKAVQDYLTAATGSYSDTDEKTNTIVSQYVNGSAYSSITRKDCPAPVILTWTNSATTSTVITIFSDETLSQKVWSQNATRDAKSADVYNLTPGVKYYYTVSENGTIWEKGYFNTTGRRRMIRVSGTQSTDRANNCRDLGGMVTKDGSKRIKYGYIFRGSNMDNTIPSEKDILVNFMKIRMDIDLRVSGGWGTQAANREFTANDYPEVGYLNRGFSGYDDLASDAGLGRVGDIFNMIMDTVLDGKAVYFHCYVGADRTGIIGVMLEGLLGISEKDSSIDYELTSFSTAVGMRPRDGSQNDHYFTKGLALLRRQIGETFQEKCNNFLTSSKVGVSQAKIDQFKSFILENNN